MDETCYIYGATDIIYFGIMAAYFLLLVDENRECRESCTRPIIGHTRYFLQDVCLRFILHSISQICFKFSLIFVILFFGQFNGLFMSIKTKIWWGFQSVFTSMVDAFARYRDVQGAMGQGYDN